jgi:hypothetical protein
MTVDDIFREARQQCRHLYPEQEINAMVRVLLQHYTGLTTAQIYTSPNFQFSTNNCCPTSNSHRPSFAIYNRKNRILRIAP